MNHVDYLEIFIEIRCFKFFEIAASHGIELLNY